MYIIIVFSFIILSGRNSVNNLFIFVPFCPLCENTCVLLTEYSFIIFLFMHYLYSFMHIRFLHNRCGYMYIRSQFEYFCAYCPMCSRHIYANLDVNPIDVA